MIYHTFAEILKAVLYSCLFGVFLNIVNIFVGFFFDFVRSILCIPENAVMISGDKVKFKEYLKTKKIISKREDGMILLFVKDFLCILIDGILFSLLLYITTDGMFRAYVFLLVILFFAICKKTVGRLLYIALDNIVSILIKTVTLASALIVYPLKRISKKMVPLLKKTCFKLKIKPKTNGKVSKKRNVTKK